MIITLLRKPLEGTVAENTLKHGCGAINIDATRVSFDDNESINFEARQRQQTASYKESGWSGHVAQVGSDLQMYKEKGRWPANFILTHKEGCELKGTKKSKETGRTQDPKEMEGGVDKSEWRFRPTSATKRGYSDEDGKETIPDWACVEGCPVKNLDKQAGVLVSVKDVNPTNSNVSGFFGKTDNYYSSSANYGDRGGASRFFRQFKKDNDQ